MSYAAVKLLGFTPDLPQDTPGAITAMAGFIPTTKGFAFGAILATDNTNTTNSVSLGAFSAKQAGGTQRWWVGTATKIYESNSTGSSLTDRSLTSYSASTTQTWSFCQFGDVTLATNYGNVIGQINAGGAFASVAGAPKAQIILNAGPPTSPFILAMNYDDGVTPNKAGVYNSAIADYTGWTVGTLQSAQFTIYEPSGPIVAGIAYRDGAIAFKDGSMFELSYSNATATPGWGARRIASDVGIAGKNMCVNVNDTIYFADKRGIWMYDGSYPKKLPGYIHDYWAQQVAAGNVDDTCQVKWDAANHNLWVSFKASTRRSWLVWNQLTGLWGAPTLVGFASGSTTTGNNKTVREFVSFDGTPLATILQDGSTPANLDQVSSGVLQFLAGAQMTTPSMTLWYIGDAVGMTRLQRIAPLWSSNSLPSNSTATAIAYTAQGVNQTGTSGAVSIGPVSGLPLYFDAVVEGNWIKVTLTLTGFFEFGAVGLSTVPAGQRGIR